MPSLDLPIGLRGDKKTPKQIKALKNYWFEPGEINTASPVPGIELIAETSGFCRGAGRFKDDLYQVVSDELIRFEISAGGGVTQTIIGQVGGAADCILQESFTKLLILVKGESQAGVGLAYTWDGTNFLKITDPDFLPSIDVTFLLSRFVFCPADGGPFFWSEVNNPASIDPQKFADAESLPDKNTGVAEWRDNLLVFGAKTIERQTYNTTLQTFQRTQGATIDVGYISGRVQYIEDILFIGREPNGDRAIYSYANRNRISTKAVEEILYSYKDYEIDRVRSQSFTWEGTPMVVWTFPNHSLLYYGDFSIISSGITGDLSGVWDAVFTQEVGGRLVCGSQTNRRVGQLVDISTDYGERKEFEIRTYIRLPPRANFPIDRIIVSMTTGKTNSEVNMSLSLSEDGIHFYDEVWQDLGDAGILDNEISWGSPMGIFDNYCGIKLRSYVGFNFPIDSIQFE